MKLYKIYFSKTEEGSELEPVLYAFTNEKSYAESFMETRNKKYFRLLVSEKGKKEYEYLRHHFNSLLLMSITLRTVVGEERIKKNIQLIGTRREYDEFSKAYTDFPLLFGKYFTSDPRPLKKEYLEVANKLGYVMLYEWVKKQNEVPFAIDAPSYETEYSHILTEGPFYNGNIEWDEYQLFYYLFGGTFQD